jgi:hypothetical protein
LLISRRTAAAIALTALAWTAVTTLASCTSPAKQRAADVVAAVGEAEVTVAEITVAEVKARLPAESTGPPVVRPGVEPPDTWRDALRLAIRDELLSLEAARRDPEAHWAPDPAGRAARIRAVTDQERARSPELRESNITAPEARSWLARNHHRFDVVETAQVAWASFTDGDRARAMLDSAVGLDQARFLALAAEQGTTTGTAMLDSSGNGADALVARVAFAVRTAGAVGLTAADGQWWVVRVDSIRLSTPPWDDELAGRVRAAIAWEREQAHLDSLARQLESRWRVSVDEQRFAATRP